MIEQSVFFFYSLFFYLFCLYMLPLSCFNMYHLYLHLSTNKHIYIFQDCTVPPFNFFPISYYLTNVSDLHCHTPSGCISFKTKSFSHCWGYLRKLFWSQELLSGYKQVLFTKSILHARRSRKRFLPRNRRCCNSNPVTPVIIYRRNPGKCILNF